MAEEILRVDNLDKFYGDWQALHEISFSIERGEVLTLLGPSGSGKSTLIRCLNGLEEYRSGTIVFEGQKIVPSEKNWQKIRQKIGMVFQSYDLFPHLTVLDNILLAPTKVQKRSKDEVKEEAMKLLRRVGLEEKAGSYPRELSGGQKQRVAIARALATKPAILLCDEPTGNLDSRTSQDVLGLLKVTSQQYAQTIVMITHNEEIAQLADRIIRIEDGRIRTGGQEA